MRPYPKRERDVTIGPGVGRRRTKYCKFLYRTLKVCNTRRRTLKRSGDTPSPIWSAVGAGPAQGSLPSKWQLGLGKALEPCEG